MHRLLLSVALAVCAGPALAAPVPVAEVIEQAVEGYIRPGFDALAGRAETLETNAGGLCATPSDQTLAAARQDFKAVVDAFSRIEFVRFGPLSQDNRYDRLFFWPDRRGIALRQIQELLATPLPDEPLDMAGKSVALQGLGALEFVLFGTGSDTLATAEGATRCAYGAAIAAGIADVSAAIAAEWADPDGIAARMEHPQPDNTDFRSHTEVLEALNGALAHGVEAIRDTRLLPFLGKDGKTYKPKSAPFWRSAMTGPALKANFEGLFAFYDISQIGLATEEQNLWVDNGIRFEFANAMGASASLASPVEQGLADAGEAQSYAYALILTRSLQTLLGENLAAALGLSVGFSSLDGD